MNEKFRSISVSVDTLEKLKHLSKNRFEVEVSIQSVIAFLLEQNKKSSGKRAS
jgi:hypothetical protein|tara:strand:- start:245 stop:403 length:159 start_codon:yes stop_codon:yes gene_type:complete